MFKQLLNWLIISVYLPLMSLSEHNYTKTRKKPWKRTRERTDNFDFGIITSRVGVWKRSLSIYDLLNFHYSKPFSQIALTTFRMRRVQQVLSGAAAIKSWKVSQSEIGFIHLFPVDINARCVKILSMWTVRAYTRLSLHCLAPFLLAVNLYPAKDT